MPGNSLPAGRPTGCLRTNNGDAMVPVLTAGLALGILPEFFLRDALAEGRLEPILCEWQLPTGAVHWVTPPGGLRPRRVDLLGAFFAEKLAPRGHGTVRPEKSTRPNSTPRPRA